MHRRKVLFYCSLSVALSAIFLLATGSSLLTLPIGKQVVVPLGNLITWAGIIALPLSAYWGIGALRTPTKRLNSILGGALKALIILAICWFPISFLLAGNLSFNFAGIPSFQGGPIAMRLFWVLSYGLALGTILIISIYWVLQLLQQVKKGRH
jgi:hypothetical protein